jgi:dTDP-4-amino-4,6-dideoxyglucose formyltransferase
MKRILVITDNDFLLKKFKDLVEMHKDFSGFNYVFSYAYSPTNDLFISQYQSVDWIRPLSVKNEVDYLVNQFDVIFSLHCKQLFPTRLVKSVRCINIHPGLNPFNRGWFPQVFSIINGLPCGVTIHEIDEYLDHGPIIAQQEVKIEKWDTSLTAYDRLLNAEIELLDRNIHKIISGAYKTFLVAEGNLNLKKDFNQLCKIELDQVDSFLNHLNRLRALTHGNYSNAYFEDEHGSKIFVKIELTRK